MKAEANESGMRRRERTKRVLVTDHISEEGIKKLREFAEVDVELGLSEAELKERLAGSGAGYDALIVRSGTQVTKEVVEAGVGAGETGAASKLKVIGRAGVGVDNIDVATATEKGVLVVNTPEANTVSAAEHTIAMLLALARKIPAANASLKSGAWERKKHTGVEVQGKVLGIIGLGRVGSEVAKRAGAGGLGMRIVAYDPFVSLERARELGISLSGFDEVFPVADFLTVHTPLTKDTRHLVGAREFGLMKNGVQVVNCARGGIIDEAALLDAIKSGKVAGAALDVFESEPPAATATAGDEVEAELLGLDEVVATPHLGASTEEAQRTAAVAIAEEVRTALEGKPVRNAVNMVYVEEELLEGLKPWLVLAEKLGGLSAQLVPIVSKSSRIEIEEFKISYEGEIAAAGRGRGTRLLTVAVLKSFLSWFADGVNFVNAEAVARKFGIKVTESKTAGGGGGVENFSSLVSLTTTTRTARTAAAKGTARTAAAKETATATGNGKEKKTVAGTLFGRGGGGWRDEPRVVKIDGFRVDAIPSGYLLVCGFLDKPRVIGPVCTVLGDEGVNIAGMQVGRENAGGEAVMVLNVDSPVGEETIKKIKKVKNIFDVRLVKL